MPSPVLKLAWQRMHTYILELDIMGFTPGSACGRAAVYSAWVCRSLGPAAVSGVLVVRRVVMAVGDSKGAPVDAKRILSSEIEDAALGAVMGCPVKGWKQRAALAGRRVFRPRKGGQPDGAAAGLDIGMVTAHRIPLGSS